MQPASLRRAVLWTLIAALLTLSYWIAAPTINHGVGYLVHASTVAGWSAAPFSWRILIPFAINLFVPLTDITAVLWAVAFLSIMLTAAALVALFAWLRVWVSEGRAWIGVGVAALLVPLMYASYVYSANLPLEVILILIGLLTLRRHHDWRYAALIALATLNRETGVYLVALYALGPDMRLRRLLRFLLMFLLTFVFANFVSPATWYWGGALDFLDDPTYLLTALVYQMPFLCLFVVALRNRKAAHPDLRRLWWFVPFNYALFLLFGRWAEVRLLFPALAVVMPLIALPRKPKASILAASASPTASAGTRSPSGG